MKFNGLLVSVVVVCATGSLMSMDKSKKGRLNFQLNKDFCITGYSKENMKFFAKPSEFLGKSILDVVPLDQKDHNAVMNGLYNAVAEGKTTTVPYELDKMRFAATITALRVGKKEDQNYNYFIKVKEEANNNNQ